MNQTLKIQGEKHQCNVNQKLEDFQTLKNLSKTQDSFRTNPKKNRSTQGSPFLPYEKRIQNKFSEEIQIDSPQKENKFLRKNNSLSENKQNQKIYQINKIKKIQEINNQESISQQTEKEQIIEQSKNDINQDELQQINQNQPQQQQILVQENLLRSSQQTLIDQNGYNKDYLNMSEKFIYKNKKQNIFNKSIKSSRYQKERAQSQMEEYTCLQSNNNHSVSQQQSPLSRESLMINNLPEKSQQNFYSAGKSGYQQSKQKQKMIQIKIQDGETIFKNLKNKILQKRQAIDQIQQLNKTFELRGESIENQYSYRRKQHVQDKEQQKRRIQETDQRIQRLGILQKVNNLGFSYEQMKIKRQKELIAKSQSSLSSENQKQNSSQNLHSEQAIQKFDFLGQQLLNQGFLDQLYFKKINDKIRVIKQNIIEHEEIIKIRSIFLFWIEKILLILKFIKKYQEIRKQNIYLNDFYSITQNQAKINNQIIQIYENYNEAEKYYFLVQQNFQVFQKLVQILGVDKMIILVLNISDFFEYQQWVISSQNSSQNNSPEYKIIIQ